MDERAAVSPQETLRLGQEGYGFAAAAYELAESVGILTHAFVEGDDGRPPQLPRAEKRWIFAVDLPRGMVASVTQGADPTTEIRVVVACPARIAAPADEL